MPSQVPALELSVWPRCAAPMITWGTVLTGGVASTVALGALAADDVPSALVEVTISRTTSPSSAGTSW